jgi:hypothetical protein
VAVAAAAELVDVVEVVLPVVWWVQDVTVTARATAPRMAAIRICISPASPI